MDVQNFKFFVLLCMLFGNGGKIQSVIKVQIFLQFILTIEFLCINCPEKVRITWLGIGRNVILEIKINKKPKYQIKLQKSPLVLDEYDPKNNPSSCVFEGYLDEKKLKTPVTVLGCPSSSEIEVIIS